jgi:type I restriction enzyme M protein
LSSLAQRTDLGERGRFRRFAREWIAGRGDNLDIAWLKDESNGNADELADPAVLASDAMREMEGALEELRAILLELGEEIADEVEE